LQRFAINPATPPKVPLIVHDVLCSPGQLLDFGTREFMESRFGHDFSQVRIHTDAQAAESALTVNALAYTAGRDVVMGAGQYAPGTIEGRKLLAHELTHTIQQRNLSQRKTEDLTINLPDDHFEKEADAIAQSVTLAPNGNQSRTLARSLNEQSGAGSAGIPIIQRKILLQNTNEVEARQFFKRHRFTGFSFGLKNKDIVVESTDDTRPAEIELEIFWSLARSNKDQLRTLDQLRHEVNNRISIVHAARTLARGRGGRQAAFGTFDPESKKKPFITLNDKYWNFELPLNEESEGFDVIMRSNKGIEASKAIEDIWRHPESYAYECYTSTAFIQYRALLLRLGEVEFNRRFSSGIVLTFRRDRRAQTETVESLEKSIGLKEEDVGSNDDYRELIPGDQIVFRSPGHGTENAIYMGADKYFAHPLGIIDDTQEIARFLEGRGVILTKFRRRINP
jgi:Domain of unknown function (DUF4157)/Protein-glutamine gamma-glutamyltransferase